MKTEEYGESEELGAPFSPKQHGVLEGCFGLQGTPISATFTIEKARMNESAGKSVNELLYMNSQV